MKTPASEQKIRSKDVCFIHRWKRFNNLFKIRDVLKRRGYVNIGIYGGGVLGTLLYEDLDDTEINVRLVIDKENEPMFPYDVPIINPEQLDDSHHLDAIVVTVWSSETNNMDFVRICDALRKRTKCHILPINDLIVDVDLYRAYKQTVEYVHDNGAKLYLLDYTRPLTKVKNPSSSEKRMKYVAGVDKFIDSYPMDHLEDLFGDIGYFSRDYLSDTHGSPFMTKNGINYLIGVNRKYFNVIDACRVTTDIPSTFNHFVHMYGACLILGEFAEDSRTISSCLQRRINAELPGGKVYKVVNHGCWIGTMDPLLYQISCYKKIQATSLEKGDIVMLLTQNLEKMQYLDPSFNEYYVLHDISSAFDRPHNYGELFLDCEHITHRGYAMIADRVYDILSEDLQ